MNPPADSTTILGTSSEPFLLSRFNEYAEHIVTMALQCRRNITILSQDFDQKILNNDAVEAAIRSFLTSNSRVARIRILVQNPEKAIHQGHRLIELSRKLSSLMEIRQPANQHKSLTETAITFDQSGFLYRELGDRPEGSGCYHDPLRALELERKFDDIWALSEPLAEFRRLSI